MKLSGGLALDQALINETEMNNWLEGLNATTGFKDYFRYRDLQILKTMANGLTQEQYWLNCGRRAELLYMLGKSSELIKKKVKEQEKAEKKSKERS